MSFLFGISLRLDHRRINGNINGCKLINKQRHQRSKEWKWATELRMIWIWSLFRTNQERKSDNKLLKSLLAPAKMKLNSTEHPRWKICFDIFVVVLNWPLSRDEEEKRETYIVWTQFLVNLHLSSLTCSWTKCKSFRKSRNKSDPLKVISWKAAHFYFNRSLEGSNRILASCVHNQKQTRRPQTIDSIVTQSYSAVWHDCFRKKLQRTNFDKKP